MRGIAAVMVLIVSVVTSMPVLAETPIRHPDCVDALEQIVVLRMSVPVFIEEGRFHRDITASKRRLELARFTRITRSSCGKDPKVRAQQDIERRAALNHWTTNMAPGIWEDRQRAVFRRHPKNTQWSEKLQSLEDLQFVAMHGEKRCPATRHSGLKKFRFTLRERLVLASMQPIEK
jgi:hypothetical protein